MRAGDLLLGAAAESALLGVGWRLTAPSAEPRAVIDAAEFGDVRVARLWLPAGTREAVRSPTALRALVVVAMDGAVSVRVGEHGLTLEPGHGTVIDLSLPTSVTHTAATTVVEVTLPLALLDRAAPASPPAMLGAGLAPLLGLATTLVFRRLHEGAGAPQWRRMLVEAVAGALAHERGGPCGVAEPALTVERPTAAALLLARLRRHIELHYADPALTATALAGALNVSRVYLHKVAAVFGTTPAREIESVRVREALAMLADGRENSLERVAQRTGFAHGRLLERAIRPGPHTTATARKVHDAHARRAGSNRASSQEKVRAR
ncbi:AraC family transcriptional regulator [Herbiconiux moechotypicola]|uniref:HTH araC/xylS-type domain-containing protein n=1 Tax=Herbiconiux moechotypicola TaxID=637393 RepID=A0ABP5QP50_9MICO|nr:helix-turn-helix transcriptional regulator [Herbiconiux moechotypicola]MCS5730608.1 AraC family transcriptional regulator [Herbiconiux moechotypicola]